MMDILILAFPLFGFLLATRITYRNTCYAGMQSTLLFGLIYTLPIVILMVESVAVFLWNTGVLMYIILLAIQIILALLVTSKMKLTAIKYVVIPLPLVLL